MCSEISKRRCGVRKLLKVGSVQDVLLKYQKSGFMHEESNVKCPGTSSTTEPPPSHPKSNFHLFSVASMTLSRASNS